MKKLLLLGAIALSVVACENQRTENAAKPAEVTDKPVVQQNIIDNTAPTAEPLKPAEEAPAQDQAVPAADKTE